MKKYFIPILMIAASIPFGSCSSNDAIEPDDIPVSSGKALIAYFTLPETDGVDAVAGASRVIVDGNLYGNVQYIAQVIHEATEGDLFEIKTVQQYPGIHQPLIDFASDEKAAGARPQLSTHIENLDDYDVIFIGYPIWWSDLPMPLYTFFDEYDFSGKTIIPFCPHGGSSWSGTTNAIGRLEPNARIVDGFLVNRTNVAGSKSDIISWLQDINIITTND